MSELGVLPIHLRIEESSMAGESRRLATSMASNLGFSSTNCGRVAIIAAELAKNILAHAGRGELIIQPTVEAGGLEMLALDKGPGMANPARCLEDGFSTAGTSGIGLGGIVRQSEVFDLYSKPQSGTIVLSQVHPSGPPRPDVLIGGLRVPIRGEQVCGDNWATCGAGSKVRILAADGSGHGQQAANASNKAIRVFQGCSSYDPVQVLGLVHGALAKTRGAAVAVAELDLSADLVRFAGVGNIAAAVVSGVSVRSMVSYNGTAGHAVRKIQQFEYPWSGDALIVLCSDGITTQWDLKPYPGLGLKHPSVVAGMIYRDFARGRDDASVVVARRPDPAVHRQN